MTSRASVLTTKEIAAAIHAHLKRLEADKAVNKPNSGGLRPFYGAGAGAGGGWVHLTYVSFQGTSSVRKADAQYYLDRLEAGFTGRHWQALRERDKQPL